MKKLRLDLEMLAVESFDTAAAGGAGTVHAAAVAAATYPNCSEIDACPSAWNCTLNGTCYDPSCGQYDTCQATCKTACGSCDSCLSNCLASGCAGCSGPVCAA